MMGKSVPYLICFDKGSNVILFVVFINHMDPPHSSGIVVFREGKDNTIEFLVLRSQWGGHKWSPPKGGLNRFEDEEKCAFRELWEETFIAREPIVLLDGFKINVNYDMDKPTKRVPDGKKRVSMFLGQLVDTGVEIRLSREHQDYAWGTVEELVVLEPHWRQCLQDCSVEITRRRLL
jgi:8-oxo-dGTP pyrophosphatase MutT (NUDIX family)